MKRHMHKIASLIAAASLSTSLVTQMPMSASAAPTYYYYNDTYSTIQYTLTTVNGEARAEITKVTSKDWVNSSGNVFIYIPTRLSGRPVSIGTNAFQYMHRSFEVNASDVREIKSYAFNNCQGLQEIYISQKCKNIASNAFYCCHNLGRAIFQGSQYSVNDNSSLTIESNAFRSCTNLNLISFGCRDDIIVKRYAFNGCSSLKNFTKDNASYDHTSLYIQAQAFNGSGLENSNSIAKESAVSSQINWSYTGQAKKMTGKVLVVDVITQAAGCPYYYGTEPTYLAAYNSDLLEKEAAKYGVNLDIINATANMTTSLTPAQIDATDSFIDRPEVLSGLKSSFSCLSSCTNMDQVMSRLKTEYGASQIAFVFDVNADRGNYAWTSSNNNYHEYAVVYQRDTYGYNHNTVWMHELAHLFGAHDAYRGKVSDPNYVDTYLTNDIMNYNLPDVGWLAACEIGWTDTALRADAAAVLGYVPTNAANNTYTKGLKDNGKPVRHYANRKK